MVRARWWPLAGTKTDTKKPRPDNQTALEATTYDRALGLHLTFARTGTAENEFPTFNPTAVNDPLCDECAARFEFA